MTPLLSQINKINKGKGHPPTGRGGPRSSG